jgi:hypothetical protein
MSTPSLPIALEAFEPGLWAFVAVSGDVQIGWCRKVGREWFVEDMDMNALAGPFRTLDDAKRAGTRVLAGDAGASNPGW